MYPYSYRGLFILYRNSYLCVMKTVHLLFPCITCLFLATGHIGVSSWPNRRLLLTLVLSVLFPICLYGGQQGRICTKFLSQYPAQPWMQPTECIPFDGKGSGVSSTGRLCPLSPRDAHTNKLAGLGLVGEGTDKNLNSCYWTGIRKNNKTQCLQTASVWKGMYFGIMIDVGRDHGVHSQYTICHNVYCEQEPGSPGQVAMSRCWTGGWVVALASTSTMGESLASGRSVGWQKSQCHPWSPYGDGLSH